MSRYLVPMVLGLTLVIAGCRKQEPPKVTAKAEVTAKEVEEKLGEAASTAADYARQQKDEYVARAQKAVDDAKAEIDKLKSGAKKARPGAKGIQRQIRAMEGRWKLAERKLSELKSASGEAWKDLKSGVDKAVEDLKNPGPSHRST